MNLCLQLERCLYVLGICCAMCLLSVTFSGSTLQCTLMQEDSSVFRPHNQKQGDQCLLGRARLTPGTPPPTQTPNPGPPDPDPPTLGDPSSWTPDLPPPPGDNSTAHVSMNLSTKAPTSQSNVTHKVIVWCSTAWTLISALVLPGTN